MTVKQSLQSSYIHIYVLFVGEYTNQPDDFPWTQPPATSRQNSDAQDCKTPSCSTENDLPPPYSDFQDEADAVLRQSNIPMHITSNIT